MLDQTGIWAFALSEGVKIRLYRVIAMFPREESYGLILALQDG
jgi:hypothetical protein